MKHREGFPVHAVVLIGIALSAVVAADRPASAQAAQDPAALTWKVWQKISPCLDTRQDWYTVAQEYPGSIGSPQSWQITFNIAMPFAAAMLTADKFKMGPGFDRRCCADWAVFKNTRTQQFEVGRVSPNVGTHPPELMLQRGGLCAENAFDLAGIPIGTIRDPRNLQLSTGETVTRMPDGTFAPFAPSGPSVGPGGPQMRYEGTYNSVWANGQVQEPWTRAVVLIDLTSDGRYLVRPAIPCKGASLTLLGVGEHREPAIPATVVSKDPLTLQMTCESVRRTTRNLTLRIVGDTLTYDETESDGARASFKGTRAR